MRKTDRLTFGETPGRGSLSELSYRGAELNEGCPGRVCRLSRSVPRGMTRNLSVMSGRTRSRCREMFDTTFHSVVVPLSFYRIDRVVVSCFRL